MDINKKRLEDLTEAIRETTNTDATVMAVKLEAALMDRGWLILYSGEVPEVDLMIEIHAAVKDALDGVNRLLDRGRE